MASEPGCDSSALIAAPVLEGVRVDGTCVLSGDIAFGHIAKNGLAIAFGSRTVAAATARSDAENGAGRNGHVGDLAHHLSTTAGKLELETIGQSSRAARDPP